MSTVRCRKIYNQEAQHDSGMILRSIDRETMQVEYQGQTLTLDVDRGLRGAPRSRLRLPS
jgi:hypothetical protein